MFKLCLANTKTKKHKLLTENIDVNVQTATKTTDTFGYLGPRAFSEKKNTVNEMLNNPTGVFTFLTVKG